jgi:hypothetical protein
MKAYLISCSLNVDQQIYKTLNTEIRKLGSGCHCLNSTWIVKSDQTSAQIATRLKPYFSSGDKFLVMEVGPEASWLGFDQGCTTWLQTSL